MTNGKLGHGFDQETEGCGVSLILFTDNPRPLMNERTLCLEERFRLALLHSYDFTRIQREGYVLVRPNFTFGFGTMEERRFTYSHRKIKAA